MEAVGASFDTATALLEAMNIINPSESVFCSACLSVQLCHNVRISFNIESFFPSYSRGLVFEGESKRWNSKQAAGMWPTGNSVDELEKISGTVARRRGFNLNQGEGSLYSHCYLFNTSRVCSDRAQTVGKDINKKRRMRHWLLSLCPFSSTNPFTNLLQLMAI